MGKEVLDLSEEFGLTFMDEADINLKYDEAKKLETELIAEREKFEEIYVLIKDFINKLKSNPDKDVIKWPNRLADLNKFEQKINNINKGK